MTKDKTLEGLFQAQTPHFTDNAQFMARLTQRLDAVEYIRQYQEANLRRYKMAIVAAFAVGIVSGAITIGFILSQPADMPLFTLQTQSSILLWIVQSSRTIIVSLLAMLMTFGFLSIVGNVYDLKRMRERMSGELIGSFA